MVTSENFSLRVKAFLLFINYHINYPKIIHEGEFSLNKILFSWCIDRPIRSLKPEYSNIRLYFLAQRTLTSRTLNDSYAA